MAKFAPLHDRILVRRVEEDSTTRGGIIIPDSAKDKPQEGEVISTGKGRTNDEGKTFPLAVAAPRRRVDRRRPAPDRGVERVGRAPAQQRTDAGEQLVGGERLGQVV